MAPPDDVIPVLRAARALAELDAAALAALAGAMELVEVAGDAPVFREGDDGDALYVLVAGACALETEGRRIKPLAVGELFGELALIEGRRRMTGVVATAPSRLLRLDRDALAALERTAPVAALALVKALVRQVSSYVRSPDALYAKLDVVLVQDGGCAPGYDSVTAFLTRYLERAGRGVFVAREGFRSLVGGAARDYAMLVDGQRLYEKLENYPGVIFAPPLAEARGASFRSERYKEFVRPELQRRAADNLIARGASIVIGIGGNGTFQGVAALARLLPRSVRVFFVPVTIDSDLADTECIGEHTGVQIGAEKIACYMADARTHHRIYLIEMMGAQGGYHALHSCIGAGADLAVLPSSRFEPGRIAAALARRRSAVIVVAEGYGREARRRAADAGEDGAGNAATWLYRELLEAGLDPARKVVCEPFSRDIRGAAPNYRDVALSHRFARRIAALVLEGKDRVMPAILRDTYATIPFDEVRTDNMVESEDAALGNLLGV